MCAYKRRYRSPGAHAGAAGLGPGKRPSAVLANRGTCGAGGRALRGRGEGATSGRSALVPSSRRRCSRLVGAHALIWRKTAMHLPATARIGPRLHISSHPNARTIVLLGFSRIHGDSSTSGQSLVGLNSMERSVAIL